MITRLLLIFIFCISGSIMGQSNPGSKSYSIIRSNLGVGGSSAVVSTQSGRYIVSQSIGQSSVIGTFHNKGYILRQGYQQPLHKIKVASIASSNNLEAVIHPNPFEHSVAITFNQNMEKLISVLVFDVTGKMVFSQDFSPSQHIELNLEKISSGSYYLKIINNSKLFNAKLIKK